MIAETLGNPENDDSLTLHDREVHPSVARWSPGRLEWGNSRRAALSPTHDRSVSAE